jgi:DNA-directed RNA polymerase specialized sigma24 family protein
MDERKEPKPRSLAAQKQLLALLAAEEWESVLKELLAYTFATLRNRVWLGVWGGHVPGAREAHDIVMETVIDIIEGRRSADAGVPLIAMLKSIIQSKISHRLTNRIDPPPQDRELDEQIAALDPSEHQTEPLDLVSKETEQINGRLIDLLIDDLSDDAELQKLLECHLDEVFKREEIAARMGKTVSEITNLKKRFDRRLQMFRTKFADKNPFVEPKK